MDRRRFLASLGGLTISQGLAGCTTQNRAALKIHLLSGSMPPQVVQQFRNHLKQASQVVKLDFVPEPQLQTLFTLLQTWKQQPNTTDRQSTSSRSWSPTWAQSAKKTPPDLVMLGHYWLEQAIQQNLIQSIDPAQIPTLEQLYQETKWRTLVTRNQQGQPDDRGKIWGAPYRWGSTVIAYRRDIFEQKQLPVPTDWSDLWRPELRGQISLPDQAREVIGLTLKKLGQSYNTTNLNQVSKLLSELQALHQQVKLYSSNAYLQPLLLGDTWVAVGWSTDILPLMQRSPQIAAVVPKSGTALWAELWVRPATTASQVPDLVKEWISFCLKPDLASQLSLLSWAAAPVLLTAASNPSQQLSQSPVLLPDKAILQASDFLQPLPKAAIEQYRTIWKTLRQVG